MIGYAHRVFVLALAVCWLPPAFSESLAELQAAGRVHIHSALSPDAGIVPGQRVALTLEVATDTGFTGGTRIGIPEVPGLVIVQSEQFATNATETREGTSWVIQRWTLDVFPQRAGEFTLGPVPVHVRVNAGASGDATGELRSLRHQISVTVPKSLAKKARWVAAPAFTVSQSFDRPLDSLAVGDAFEQEIRFEATDVMAKMLPGYPVHRQAGLAAHPAPATLEDNVNRGQMLASRSERISYVIEQPGQFLIPATEFYWWNTQRAELEVLSLPETRIDVAGNVAAHTDDMVFRALRTWHWWLLALVVGVMCFVLRAFRHRPLVARARNFFAPVQRLRRLFKPALATRLNPGSNDAQ